MKKLLLCFVCALCLIVNEIPAFAELLQGICLPDPSQGAVQVDATIQLSECVPYDASRTQQLNKLLKHMQFRFDFQQIASEAWGKLTVRLKQQEALSVAIKKTQEFDEVQFSFQPDTAYITKGNQTAGAILGLIDEPSQLQNLNNPLFWCDDGYLLANQLDILLAQWATTKKIHSTITGMGMAETKSIITIPKASVDEAIAIVRSACPPGALKEFLSFLTFNGKQVFTVLRDNSGQMLKVSYTGQCGLGEDRRNVTISWTMCRNHSKQADNFSLKSPAKTGTNRNNVAYTRLENLNDDSSVSCDVVFRHEYVINKKKNINKLETSLLSKNVNSGIQLSGTITLSHTPPGQGEQEQIVILKPQLILQDTTVQGTALFERKSEKRVLYEGSIALSAKEKTFFPWMRTSRNIELSNLTEAEYAALTTEIRTSLQKKIVRRLVLLPKEEVSFLSSGLSDEDWSQITKTAQIALQKEEQP